jgi:hypothetical protein
MENIIKIVIVALIVNILLFVVGQNYIFGIIDNDIQKYRKEDNDKLYKILNQYQQFLEESQKNNFEIQKVERKKTEKIIKDEIQRSEDRQEQKGKYDISTLCSRIPEEIRHNPKILLNKDIYNHIHNIVNMASSNLPKLEDKGFIKDSNIDNILDEIQYSEIFKNNKIEEPIVNEKYNNNNQSNNNQSNNNQSNNNQSNNNQLNNELYHNYDTSYHTHSQNSSSMIPPMPMARDLESYKFINNKNPFNFLGGKSV